MQQLLDYIAIVAFVVVYFITRDVFLATGVLMAGVALQVAAYWVLKKPIGNELKITFWASMILGGATLVSRDETFIQWKPTIVNWVLSIALVVTRWFTGKFLIQRMLGHLLILPNQAWRNLTYGWSAGFLVAGALNLWVAYNFDMDTWVTFKFIGLMGLSFTYLTLTFIYLYANGWLAEENLPQPDTDDTTGSNS